MKYLHIALFIKPDSDEALKIAQQVESILQTKAIECTRHDPYITCPILPPQSLAIVLGGDGTILAAARCLHGTKIPLAGVNLGRLGFLAELSPDKIAEEVEILLKGTAEEEHRCYGLVDSLEGEKRPFVNDVVLQRFAEDKLLDFSLQVGPRPMATFRADGVIVATPTGSTAYTLSSGGPIVHPLVPAWVITPLGAHTLSFRPAVVPQEDVTVTLLSNRAYCTLDGQPGVEIKEGTSFVIKPSHEKLTLLHPQGRNFYALLRQKLGWNA